MSFSSIAFKWQDSSAKVYEGSASIRERVFCVLNKPFRIFCCRLGLGLKGLACWTVGRYATTIPRCDTARWVGRRWLRNLPRRLCRANLVSGPGMCDICYGVQTDAVHTGGVRIGSRQTRSRQTRSRQTGPDRQGSDRQNPCTSKRTFEVLKDFIRLRRRHRNRALLKARRHLLRLYNAFKRLNNRLDNVFKGLLRFLRRLYKRPLKAL